MYIILKTNHPGVKRLCFFVSNFLIIFKMEFYEKYVNFLLLSGLYRSVLTGFRGISENEKVLS